MHLVVTASVKSESKFNLNIFFVKENNYTYDSDDAFLRQESVLKAKTLKDSRTILYLFYYSRSEQ